MRRSLTTSVLLLSIDWSPSQTGRAPEHREQLSADKLIRLLQRYELATTWALHDPHASPIPEMLHDAALPHEVSLLMSDSWSGPQSNRRQFCEQLQLRVDRARAQGVAIRSLSLSAGRRLRHVDLVQKQQVSAIRMDDDRLSREQNGRPYPVRFGLWNVPANRTLPEHQRWVWSPAGNTKRMIRSVGQGQTAHVVIDGDQLANRRFADLRALEQVLRNIAHAQQAGRLNVDTVARVVDRFTAPVERHSACSILRKAA